MLKMINLSNLGRIKQLARFFAIEVPQIEESMGGVARKPP
jgi:hypothetical protein